MSATAAPATLPVPRSAELRLRGRRAAVRATVAWPAPADRSPALVVYFPDAAQPDAYPAALARALSAVVLSAAVRSSDHDVDLTALDDASAVLGWAADHAAELDADPDRLVVAGDGAGAALAAAVALHARDQWWPAIAHQLLLHPELDAWQASVPYASSLREAPLEGAAPTTIVTGPGDDGACLAARLRAAGVAVDELAGGAAALPELARTLRALV